MPSSPVRINPTRRTHPDQESLVQIAIDENYSSGRGYQEAHDEGCVTPEELGFQPPCQLRDCWLPATVATRAGGYCSRYHAQLAISYVEGEVLEGADMTKRAKQVAAIAIN